MSQQYVSNQPTGFKNHVEKVAVVGIGGRSGQHITTELLKTGKHKVTAITRADSTSTPPEGVTVAKVDYEDPSSIAAALKGHDALVITMSVTAPPDSQAKLIEAAAAAKVPWVIPNEYGSDVTKEQLGNDVFLGKQYIAARDLLKKHNTSFTGISCSFWYEYSLSFHPFAFGFDIPKKEVTFYDDGQTKICTTTLPQTGRSVAHLLSLPILPKDANDKILTLDSFRNSSCYVSSFFVSQRDILDSILRVTGDKESDWTIHHQPSKERYEEGLKQMQSGDRMGFMKLLYSRAFYPDGSGDFREKLDGAKLGLPVEDLDEWTGKALQMKQLGA